MAAFAVTTRTLPTRIEGLAVGIERLKELCPSGVVLEATSTQPLPDVAAAMEASGRPVLAVIGGLFGVADADPFAPLDAEDGRRAISGLRATVPGCARLSCERLVVPISSAPDAELPREQLADRLCRRLHGLVSAEPGLQYLLLASTESGSRFDPEVAGWVMDDLSHANVGVALDQLSVAGHEPWFAALEARVGLVLLGAGLAARSLSASCGDHVPWAIRGPST